MRDNPEEVGSMSGWEHVEALPNATDVLKILRSDWIIALATNAVDSDEEEIRLALKRVDLDKLIDEIYCYKRIGRKKPSPDFFNYILNDLKTDRSRVIMIGDSFENDVLGANKAGIRAVWFNSNSSQNKTGEMYKTIHNLNELPAIL